ncbi:MAG TPA: hypothetical protein VGS58_21370 [Candidatus Sulfopaludibacter sp.]|nr:hypothetical protein [Candidatus Sulfopaludibacter sp.]
MIRVLREQHEPPEAVRRRLEIAGGRNRFGEPNYRAVWGWSRLGWVGGRWEDRNAAGELLRECVELRRVPKYAPHDRWHIERWLPPEAYGSPRAWYAQTIERVDGPPSIWAGVPALGPYPERGEYEHCFTLEGPRGEFVQLTPTAAEYIARAIEAGRHASAAERRQAIEERERRGERHYDNWAWDVLDDGSPAFHGLHCVSVL